jgi:predicted thioesterase
MNMLNTGIKGHQEEIVTPELCANHLGSGTVKVFATPMMVTIMERTCRLSVQPELEPGCETVGTAVNIKHVSSTPVGMKVWCDSELIQIDGRRLVFSVKAYDEKGLIGEGTHERFIINVSKFQAKTDAKLA